MAAAGAAVLTAVSPAGAPSIIPPPTMSPRPFNEFLPLGRNIADLPVLLACTPARLNPGASLSSLVPLAARPALVSNLAVPMP